MKKFLSSLVLALAVVGLPMVLSGLTGCQENNKAEQIEGAQEQVTPDMEKEYEKALEAEQNEKPPADE